MQSDSIKHRFYQFLLLVFVIVILLGCGRTQQFTNQDTILLNSKLIIGSLNWVSIQEGEVPENVFTNSNSVADIRIKQKGTRCTGFLISNDLLMTNNHCVSNSYDAIGVKAYFNHRVNTSDKDWNEFSCDQFILTNIDLDFTILKCNNSPGEEFGFLKLSEKELGPNDSIYIVQQNCDYYITPECDWDQKYAFGYISSYDETYSHNADTLGGSSGSPIFDYLTNEVIAIHNAGFGNNGYGRGVENYGVPFSKILTFLQNSHESIFNQINDNNQFAITTLPFERENVFLETDEHVYSFSLEQESKIKTKVNFSHYNGDLDIKILNSNFEVVRKGNSSTDDEVITNSFPAGKYYLVVYGYHEAKNHYSVQLKYTNNNSFYSATSTVVPTAKYDYSISSSSDLDYYKFELNSAQSLSLILETQDEGQDLDLYLFDQNKNLISVSESTTPTEEIIHFLEAGKYYVLVKGYNNATGKYNLIIE
ncbi:MAG: trypsin-like peptidase domain-containing protein [Bdellovibrionales bacterium]|jgi:hypothetical protein|nr:trypsin-like peptidase domain-containing protein [Bdellovibrionales bacterium]